MSDECVVFIQQFRDETKNSAVKLGNNTIEPMKQF